MSKYALDPSLPDEEIKQSFTPLQREFYEWQKAGGSIREAPIGQLRHFLENKFSTYDDVWEQWDAYITGWTGRARWSILKPLSREVLLEIIQGTLCNDFSLYTTKNIVMIANLPDLLLGESRFGGTWTGYAVAINPESLDVDSPIDGQDAGSQEENSDDDVPALIDSSVLSITTDDPQALSQSQDVSQTLDEDSGGGQQISSLTREHICFFQLGELMACTGEEWQKIRLKPEHEMGDADWRPTCFSVVVELDHNSHPTVEFMFFTTTARKIL